MQRLAKEGFLLAFVVASLILFAFALLMPTNTITNVSAVEANEVGVYWDSSCADADKVYEIKWGNLTPGSSRSRIVYIRNEIAEPIYLTLSTQDWDPSEASLYMTLRWDYTWQRMNVGEVLQIMLTLSVSRSIEGISRFSFDILVTGSKRLPGDVDGDDVVDPMDLLTLRLALSPGTLYYGTTPGADVNMDGYIDPGDLMTFKIILSSVRAQH